MGNKGILGGKIANAVDIHQEALHLVLQPVMMPILFLMKSNQKLSVIKNTRSLLGLLGNSALSGFCKSTMRCTSVTSQRIDSSSSKNSFNGLREALVIGVVKIYWLLGRFRVDGFDRHINPWQEDEMIAHRGLIVDRRVKLDEAHYPWSIKFQTK